MPNPIRFHLIANAHLDPVWLWDWREGFNEAINTTRSMLDLLDEDPDLTVVRGESALYEFVEREAPDLFARVRAAVAAGRWELVGGTYIQADHNLPATESLLRQFRVGQEYFESRFGRRTAVAWAPDAFGHSAGLPAIFAASGIRYFAHCRPFASELPLSRHTYWWESPSGERVLAYRSPVDWYCHDRDSLPGRLDAYLAAAESSGLRNIAVFYGVGNHGGGPTRRILADLRAWTAAHPEVSVEHSGLQRYFHAIEAELAADPALTLPVVRGELGHCLRGCYAATSRIKHAYRRAEHQFLRAARVRELAASAGADLAPNAAETAALAEAERGLLFNAFHDILPGSSIERAYDDQLAQLGGVFHTAQRAEFAALNALARRIDTAVPAPAAPDLPTAVPFLVLNPHGHAFAGPVEFEAQLDWRPIPGYRDERTALVPIEVRGPDGQPVPFQRLTAENRSMTDCVWRVRVAVPVALPARSWQVLTVGFAPQPARVTRATAVLAAPDQLANEHLRLTARIGDDHLHLTDAAGRPLLAAAGLQIKLFDDPYGSWGGMKEEPDSWHLTAVRETFRISHVTVLENGPELVRLWVRFAGARSRVDFTFTLAAGRKVLDTAVRVFIDDRSARLKLLLPGFDRATFEVPGGECLRTKPGEYPGIGYAWAETASVPTELGGLAGLGVATDAVYGFSLGDDSLGLSLARASRYADDLPTPADALPHLPASDSGEFRLGLLLTPDRAALPAHALHLQQPILVQSVPPASGT